VPPPPAQLEGSDTTIQHSKITAQRFRAFHIHSVEEYTSSSSSGGTARQSGILECLAAEIIMMLRVAYGIFRPSPWFPSRWAPGHAVPSQTLDRMSGWDIICPSAMAAAAPGTAGAARLVGRTIDSITVRVDAVPGECLLLV